MFFLVLTGLSCEEGNEHEHIYEYTPPSTPIGHQETHFDGCKFYKVQSLIIDCHEDRGFFTEQIGQRKDITATICAKQAFSKVFGVSFNPSLPAQENSEDDGFRWWFILGNIQLGDLPPSPPHPLEIRYSHFLNYFKNSLDAEQLNQCLGGNYPLTGPVIIKTALEMIKLDMLEPETFVKCYREQLEQYGIKACNAVITPQNP